MRLGSYWSTDSMGFHEYLLLCERLGAIPMYVAYAGMTWTPNSKSPFGVLEKHKIPVSDLPDGSDGPHRPGCARCDRVCQRAGHELRGARCRAKAGHPAPFGLKYIEIGNEDGFNPLYTDRTHAVLQREQWRAFPDAGRSIANDRRGRTAGELPMDLVDEHTYTLEVGGIDMASGSTNVIAKPLRPCWQNTLSRHRAVSATCARPPRKQLC